MIGTGRRVLLTASAGSGGSNTQMGRPYLFPGTDQKSEGYDSYRSAMVHHIRLLRKDRVKPP